MKQKSRPEKQPAEETIPTRGASTLFGRGGDPDRSGRAARRPGCSDNPDERQAARRQRRGRERPDI